MVVSPTTPSSISAPLHAHGGEEEDGDEADLVLGSRLVRTTAVRNEVDEEERGRKLHRKGHKVVVFEKISQIRVYGCTI